MEIIDQLEVFEKTIDEASQAFGGEAAVRLFTVYREVLLYLLETNRLEITDDFEQFWDYVKNYTPGALYRVARYHRKKHGQPVLGYGQPVFHIKEDTLND
ncbi:hypothetical protein [Salinicoccus luteus]|uniref:hypothetical protein n=1 Tax=Salinicoccus luteus TaxID=367840 RepID=UPI0004E133BC|nr:hypothetical protein [Salinicoccus luteus]